MIIEASPDGKQKFVFYSDLHASSQDFMKQF